MTLTCSMLIILVASFNNCSSLFKFLLFIQYEEKKQQEQLSIPDSFKTAHHKMYNETRNLESRSPTARHISASNRVSNSVKQSVKQRQTERDLGSSSRIFSPVVYDNFCNSWSCDR